MSLIDIMTPSRRGRALAVRNIPERAPALRTEIGALEQQLTALADERPEVAFDAINNFAGAAERLAELDSKAAELSARLGVLRSACSAAEAVDARAADARAADQRRASLAAVARHLKERDGAADRLSKAIAEAIEAYRELLDQSRQAQGARPAGEPWPDGALTDPEALARLVSTEIHRLDRPATVPIFPRGAVPVLPNLTPLAEQIRRSSRFVLDQLTRQPPDRRSA